MLTFDLRWWLLNKLSDTANLQLIYSSLALFLFFWILFSALYSRNKFKFTSNILNRLLLSDFIFVFLLAAFILAGRWPVLLAPQLNVDESFFIAGARKLLQDPIFWRSVDGTTSGPLNIYPLIMPFILGLQIEYASARLVGLALIILSTVCLYYSLRYLYGSFTSRISVIPVVTCFAFMSFRDFVHYGSEHVSIALLSLALLILCRYQAAPNKSNNYPIIIFGFIIGLIPFAKLQAFIMAIALSLIFIHLFWVRCFRKTIFFRKLGLFSFGFISFSIFVIFSMAIFSNLNDFYITYIKENLLYLNSGEDFLKRPFLWPKIIFNSGLPDTAVFFRLTVVVLIFGFICFIGRRKHIFAYNKPFNPSIFIYYALFLLISAICCVVYSPNLFPHYLLFLIMPCGFAIGVFLGYCNQVFLVKEDIRSYFKMHFSRIIIIVIIGGSLLMAYNKCLFRKDLYILLRKSYVEKYNNPIAKAILKYASFSETMVIWGWNPKLYIQTGLIQGTRDVHTARQIRVGLEQGYFVKRFAGDFLNSQASIFVDSVSPEMFLFHDRLTQGHEAFPEIAAIVKEHYKLAEEIQGVRIYVKKR